MSLILNNWVQFFYFVFLSDCGDSYTIANGHLHYSGYSTTYNSTVPVHCTTGYIITGDAEMTCGKDGLWKGDAHCQIIGKRFIFIISKTF